VPNTPNHSGRAVDVIDRAARWLAVLGGIAVIALVAITAVAVFFRYVVNDPIFGINDLSRMVLLVIVAGAVPYGGRAGAHVSVDVLGMFGGRAVTRWTDVVVRLLGIVIACFATYGLVKQGLCGVRCGHFTPNLAIPFLPFYMLLALSVGGYALVLLVELIAGLDNFGASEDPSEQSREP
jgi:TRAP-type C4-dicarboxylate transport system permease small subunit